MREAGHSAIDKVAAEHIEDPARMKSHVHDCPHPKLKRDKPATRVVFPFGQDRHVDGDHNGLGAHASRAFNQLIGDRAVVVPIDLHPEARRGRCGDVFERRNRIGGDTEGRIDSGARLRERDLALVPHQSGGAGRRHDERAATLHAEQLGRQRPIADIDQHGRDKAQRLHSAAQFFHATLVLCPARHELEEAPRQPRLRPALVVIDIQ